VNTLAILPVKSFASAKQRLAGLLGAEARRALARAMFSDVLGSLRRVPGLDVVVVTADCEASTAASDRGVRVLADTAEAGQSAAALIGIRHALAEGHERVVLVPGDTPLLQPGHLAGLIADAPTVAIVPDRHRTGTNALLLSPPDAIEPSFGPHSLARHVTAAERAGVAHRVEEVRALALDVDTPEDLAELAAELELRRAEAPATRAALSHLYRAGSQPAGVPQASD
jgi:2-phospho-L-lactate guanylyltransferase